MAPVPSNETTTAVPTTNPTTRAYVILLLSVASFGATGIFAKLADAPGMVVATWRVLVAMVLLTIPYLRQPAHLRRLDGPRLRSAWIGATFFAASVVIFHIALDYTTASNATFLGNLAPIWVGLLTLFVLRQRLPRLFWPGVVVALFGAALIVFGNGGLQALRTGDIIVLFNSSMWAAYQVVTGQARARVSTVTWVWVVVAISTLYLVPLTLLTGNTLFGYSTTTMLAMFSSGMISQTGGFLGYSFALGFIDATRVSVINLLQPVVTTIFAVLLLSETFVGWQILGGFLVLAGVYLVNSDSRAAKHTNEA